MAVVSTHKLKNQTDRGHNKQANTGDSCKQASKRAKRQTARDVSAVYPKSPVALSLLVPENLLPATWIVRYSHISSSSSPVEGPPAFYGWRNLLRIYKNKQVSPQT